MSGTVGTKEKEFALARILELVALVFDGVPKTRAYRKVYPHSKCNANSANRQANRILAKYDEMVGEDAGELLKKYNLDVPRVIIELEKRLNAEHTLSYQGRVSYKKGPDGKLVPETTPDNSTRMRATELLARFHGLDRGYSGAGTGDHITNNVIMLQETLSEDEWEKRYGGGVTQ